jgi:chromosome segregation ATPase
LELAAVAILSAIVGALGTMLGVVLKTKKNCNGNSNGNGSSTVSLREVHGRIDKRINDCMELRDGCHKEFKDISGKLSEYNEHLRSVDKTMESLNLRVASIEGKMRQS